MRNLLLALLFLVVVPAGAVAGYAFWWANTPASGSSDEVVVEIPRGSSLVKIASLLEQNGVLRDARAFRYYVQVVKKQNKLRAGEFRLRKDLTPSELLDMLVRGEVVLHRITVPEGYAVKDIARVVGASGLATEADFLALADDAAFARELGIPADRLEGYLFPDTYSFAKGVGAREIATAMYRRFQEVWTDDLKERASATYGLTTHQAVTLASIIEKETGQPYERPIISGVFHNRLKKGMRLESDPTIIYGIKDYDGDIRRKDIRDPSNIYNTYVIKGLPPGPIASPGAEALRSVVYPAEHSYYFFVAKGLGSGVHHFSPTYEEHARMVRKYLLTPRPKAQTDRPGAPDRASTP